MNKDYEKAKSDILEGIIKMRQALWGTQDLEYLDYFVKDCAIIIKHAENADACINSMAREISQVTRNRITNTN